MGKRVARSLAVFVGVLSFCIVRAQAQSPSIQEIVNRVNLDSLTNTIKVLSGETSTIVSRHFSQPGHGLAIDFMKRKLVSYGLAAQTQHFVTMSGINGTNILVEQVGRATPTKKYIICAHYDSQNDSSTTAPAPGADDNASGCATVIEAARILSGYSTSYTVVFALWDLEELGMNGSATYVDSALTHGDTILGVINLDMLGWDGDNDSMMNIHTSNIGISLQLADTVATVLHQYTPGLKPTIYNPGASSSDHRSFWRKGYGAIMLTQQYWGGDFNPHQHADDFLRYFNRPYYHELAKLATASIAFLAGVGEPLTVNLSPRPVKSYYLEQNFPNPFNPRTTIYYSLPARNEVHLAVYNVLGQEVAKLVNQNQEAGEHEVQFDGTRLSSGVYYYRLQAGANTLTRTMVIVK